MLPGSCKRMATGKDTTMVGLSPEQEIPWRPRLRRIPKKPFPQRAGYVSVKPSRFPLQPDPDFNDLAHHPQSIRCM